MPNFFRRVVERYARKKANRMSEQQLAHMASQEFNKMTEKQRADVARQKISQMSDSELLSRGLDSNVKNNLLKRIIRRIIGS